MIWLVDGETLITDLTMAPSSLRMGLLSGITTILYGSSIVAANDLSNDSDLLKYVDPLIGTAKGGSL